MYSLLIRSVVASAFLVSGVSGHGWITTPVSKNEMAYHHYQDGMPGDFRYEPQSCNIGNGIGQMLNTGGASCGAKSVSAAKGLHVWKQWYDKAKVPVPHFVPGSDVAFNITLTIDHGGQGWMMLACAEDIKEANEWVILPRSMHDRKTHFMPSAPGAIAWAPLEFEKTKNNRFTTWHHIPESFSCPSGHGVARWVWKTGNTCNDANNIARKTEKFNMTDLAKVYHTFRPGWVDPPCTSPPESFISCLDFSIGDAPPGPPGPPGGPGNVSACHDAAKAYCDAAGRGFCRACQAYGAWGDMFFVTVCNNNASHCNEPVTAADGTVCSCQRASGCVADGVTCPGTSGPGPSPPTPAPKPKPSPSPKPKPSPAPKAKPSPAPKPKPPHPGRNPFPRKVTWGYYFLGNQPYQSPKAIIAQGVNYVCISFGNIGSGGTFAFPGGGCAGPDTEYCKKFMSSNGTADQPTGPAFFQQLHDAGVTISITVGGAGASVPAAGTDPSITLTSFKAVLQGWGIEPYVDGIDFDWENSMAGPAINNLAPAFKNAGYVVTSAPMASQLHGGCGYKWQEDDNELSIMDYTHMDGILIQWYQGACENLGHCPHAQCGKSPGAGCFDMNFSVQILTLLEGPGACAKSGKQNGNTFANCSGVLDTCKTFPLEKIAIGVGLYYQVGQAQGLITAQNILDLDKQLGHKLLGAGAWDINFGFADPRSNPFFKDLAAAWSGPSPSPGPTPPNPPAPAPKPKPAPSPKPKPAPAPKPSNCTVKAYMQCGGTHGCCIGKCTCVGSATYDQCKPPAGAWKC